MASPDQALENSNNWFTDGKFFDKLSSLVNIVTDSKNAVSVEDLTSYYTDGLSDILTELGLQTEIIDNPINDGPPFLIGKRIESSELNTILLYGHGDTVPLQEGQWFEEIIPNELKIGHEAHFGQVTNNFLKYFKEGMLPDWEIPNMKAKYYTTIEAYKLATKN